MLHPQDNQKPNQYRKNTTGFSLVELLVVIAIVAILATIAITSYNNYTSAAEKKRHLKQLLSINLVAQC